VSEPTELERRIAAKVVQQTKQKRVYPERWATCLHAFKRLGEIGSAVLDECEDCGLVVGVAR